MFELVVLADLCEMHHRTSSSSAEFESEREVDMAVEEPGIASSLASEGDFVFQSLMSHK